jgi:hypothetical protein
MPRGPDLPADSWVSEPGRSRIVVSCARLGVDHPDPHLVHLESLQKFLIDQPEDTCVYWDFASAATYGRMDEAAMAEQMALYSASPVLVLESPAHKRYFARGWCFLEFTLACLGLLEGTSVLHARGVTCRAPLDLAELRTKFVSCADVEDFEAVSRLCLCLMNQDEWQAALASWISKFSTKHFTIPSDLLAAMGIFLSHVRKNVAR